MCKKHKMMWQNKFYGTFSNLKKITIVCQSLSLRFFMPFLSHCADGASFIALY